VQALVTSKGKPGNAASAIRDSNPSGPVPGLTSLCCATLLGNQQSRGAAPRAA